MATYLHYFETENDYNSARENNYNEPWVSATHIQSNYRVNYNKSEREKELGTPLTFEILGSGVISMKTGYLSSYYGGDMFRYRKNGGEWDVYDENDNPYWEINVVSGDVVEIEGNYKRYPIDTDDGRGFFTNTTCQFKLSGNIMSLMDYALEFDTAYTYAFNILFQFCTGLTDAGELLLPATTLTNNCYDGMFEGCTSLTTAPELPATTLAEGCYASMFYGCTSLTTAPELPATTLADYCYTSMFEGTSLTAAPELPATTLAESCYESMFMGCTSLTTAPELPATTLAEACYYYMFDGCTGLTTAPELPATTLATDCYRGMFSDCTNLNYIKCLATNISATNCTLNWVNGVAASGTFVKDANMSSWTRSNNGIPTNWTVQDA